MIKLQTVKQRFGIIGRNSALDRALETAVLVASTDLSVLITGETGVGKEVFSRIIHSLSPRKHNKFIAINCGAIPEGTINSELFGHVKGAFTGATSDRKGYFETVNGGTIFLDEIGEMPESTQQFLLRILENGEFIPVGSNKVLRTDVRVVAATNVKLLENLGKKFREDLYYRLSTVPITVPPLRERSGDIHLLFRKFAIDFAEKYRTTPIRLDEKAVLLLENYPWPGNIRELKNVAEKISVLSQERFLTAEELIEYLPRIAKRNLPIVAPSQQTESSSFHEREILYKLLFDMKGDLTQLKNLVSELIRINDLAVPDIQEVRQLQPAYPAATVPYYNQYKEDFTQPPQRDNTRPIITEQKNGTPLVISTPVYDAAEEEEENLKLEDMEKKLITKALTKHNGKRKDAAIELGISERTLYRKIDKYEIKE